METKKKNEVPKLSYDELRKAASELSINHQKLTQAYEALKQRYDAAVDALNDRDFQYNSFFLSSLFKVMEHPEMYKEEFVNWASDNIQAALVAFAEAGKPSEQEKEANPEEEGKDAAE